MKKLFLLTAACLITAFTWSQNTIQSGWDFNGNAGNELSVAATSNNVNLEMPSLIRGAGLTAASLANSFSAGGWTNTNSLTDAIANNDYLQFTVNAKNSFVTSLSGLEAIFRRSGTGPDHFQWQYSNDGAVFTNIGSEISFTSTTTNGIAQAPIDLSGIAAMQSVTASTIITIRLYGYNATAAGGTFSLGRLTGNDLALTGSTNSITPVNLLNFTGISMNNSINLKWTTGTEINSKMYEIEHSRDGKKYNKIGELKSANAVNGSNYLFRGNNLVAGENFYRLRIVDIDGRFEYSNILLVNVKDLMLLTVYPNPAGRMIIVRYPQTGQRSKLYLLGAGGDLRQQFDIPPGSSEININIERFSTGSYMIVWIGAGGIYSQRFIKQ